MSKVARRIAAVLAAVATCAWGPTARADVFQLEWNYRWSWGQLQHATGLPDEDPSATRSFFAGAVGSYDFNVSHELDFRHFAGSGGDVIVEEVPIACSWPADRCYRRQVTFDLGAVFAAQGNPETFRLVADVLPHFDEPWDAPPPQLGSEGSYELSGALYGSSGSVYNAMSLAYATSSTRVAAPVPEPALWSLIALGAAVVAARARAASRNQGPGSRPAWT